MDEELSGNDHPTLDDLNEALRFMEAKGMIVMGEDGRYRITEVGTAVAESLSNSLN